MTSDSMLWRDCMNDDDRRCRFPVQVLSIKTDELASLLTWEGTSITRQQLFKCDLASELYDYSSKYY